ncbi:MAG: YfhO family protein [Candidatus Marinimicrobia bacterium]|nr:YfhO family protein [Candidatus Neomarinimicrobiota bacterium]
MTKTKTIPKSTKPSHQSLPSWIKNPYFYIIAGFVFILIVLYFKVLFLDQDFSQPDAVAASYTNEGLNYHFSKEHTYPLWNPYLFSGMPAYAAMSFNKFVYFPGLIMNPINYFKVPGSVFMILHYLLAGLGTYLLLRRWSLDKLSALFGGVAFMMTPYIVTMYVFGHGSQMMCAAYIPIILYTIVRLFDKPNLWNMAFAALMIGFQLQRAHVQIVYFTWMLIGAYFLYTVIVGWKLPDFRKNLLPIVGCFAGALVLGFGLSAVLYLPVANYTPFSIRGGSTGGGTGLDYATQWSFHPKEIATFFVPSYFGFGGYTYWGKMPFTDFPNYMGILVLILAVFSLVLKFRKTTLFFAIIFVLSLFISFGKFFPVYGWLYDILPYFNKFRVPSMMLIITQFSAAVLAGFGLHDLMEFFKQPLSEKRAKTVRKIIFTLSGIVGVIALYLLVFQSGLRETIYAKIVPNPQIPAEQVGTLKNIQFGMLYKDFWIMTLFLAAACITVYLTFMKKINGVTAGVILLGLSIVDLYIVDAKIIQPNAHPRQTINVKNDPAAKFLSQDQDVFRIFPVNELLSDNHWMAYRLQSIGGYHPAKVKLYQEFIEKSQFRTVGILRMMNVKYLISTRRFAMPEMEEVNLTTTYLQNQRVPVAIYRMKSFLPRAYFTQNIAVIANQDSVILQLVQPNFDPTQTAFLEKPPAIQTLSADSQSVKIDEWSIHRMKFHTFTNQPSQLVISEVYYPNGWKASIDGQPTEIFRTNYILRSISVPAGEHEIVMKYSPSDVRIGLIISCLSLVIVGFIMIRFRKERS